MTYLVDVNVLCEPTRSAPNAEAAAWLRANCPDLVVDAVIVAEVRLGILLLPPGRRRTRLEEWFHSVVRTIEWLPWDAAVALQWAQLVASLRSRGRAMPTLDSMIAASALYHDLTIATRNTRDFSATGAKVVDPFAPS